MHYKNGRVAKVGDKVVLHLPARDGNGNLIPNYYAPVIGILYDAKPGNDYCNGRVALISPSDPQPNLKECLHLDDILKALPPEVPDTSGGN